MRRNEPITNIMTQAPNAVQVGQPVAEVGRLMKGGGFHHVPVLDGSTLVGIMSAADLLRVSYATDGQSTVLDPTLSLREVMQTDVTTLRSSQTVRDAVDVFAEGQIHSLPVVDDNGHLVGIVTTTDVLRYLREQY